MRLTWLGSVVAVFILALVAWRVIRLEVGEAKLASAAKMFTAVDAMVVIAIVMAALLALVGGRGERTSSGRLPPSRPPDETRTWW